MSRSSEITGRLIEGLTWWCVWVVGGEGDAGFEVSAIVQRVRVEDDEGDGPVKDIVVVELCSRVSKAAMWVDDTVLTVLTSMFSHFSLARSLYSFMSRRSAILRFRYSRDSFARPRWKVGSCAWRGGSCTVGRARQRVYSSEYAPL